MLRRPLLEDQHLQEDQATLNRRNFIRLASAGAAAGAAQAALAQRQSAPAPRKTEPTPVTLRSSKLQVTLDASAALPLSYSLRQSGITFQGESRHVNLQARICRLDPRDYADVAVKVVSHAGSGSSHQFRCAVAYSSASPSADFTLTYSLEGATVFVNLESTHEYPGFELISVSMPSLVSVAVTSPNAWLAHADSGGDLIALTEARPGQLAANSFWGQINGVLPIIMAGHSGAVCVQETTAYMDATLQSVEGDGPERCVRLGTIKAHRVDGSACYDMNLGKGAPKSCGNAHTPNLNIEQPSTCRLDFLEPTAGRALTWLEGAKLVRSRMPKIPNRLYDDKFIYGIRTDEPKFPKPSATFERCEEIIRNVHALTGGAPQLVHLWGWQYRGKDTGYPAVNVVDERIGGYDGMMRLREQVKPLNVTLSLSDNYDDAYRSSPAWDEDNIARKPDGDLWKSREWTGEESYIQGLAKYMAGPGPERIRYTCERYKLPGTIHVDVLSYFAIRNDWDPRHPASGIRNLREGRYKILGEFARHGVDVTSEGLRYPYIGKISMAWYAGGPSPCPFGGKPIPMLSLIYRQSAVWGRAGNKGDLPVQLMMFYGEAQHSIFNGDAPLTAVLDSFYLVMVPWFRVNHTDIEDFRREGDRTVTTLAGEGNRVEIDWSSKDYRMSLEGAEVARNGSTFCPLGNDRIALYSIRDESLTATLPSGWDPGSIHAVALSVERTEPVHFTVRGRAVTIAVQSRVPVHIVRGPVST